MLGILTTEVEVGLYSGASPIARYLMIFLTAATFIYQPIATRLLAKGNIKELKRNYQILTKWIFMIGFPIFLILFLFPKTMISIFFGDRYVTASIVLQLLIIGYIVHLLFGPNDCTIAVWGKTKIIMYITIFALIINICLNYYFIPIYGINGAGLSSAIALVLQNVLLTTSLYKITEIHPFRKKYIIPLTIASVITIVMYFFVRFFNLEDTLLLFKILIVISIIVFYFALVLWKYYDDEDVQLFLLFEK